MIDKSMRAFMLWLHSENATLYCNPQPYEPSRLSLILNIHLVFRVYLDSFLAPFPPSRTEKKGSNFNTRQLLRSAASILPYLRRPLCRIRRPRRIYCIHMAFPRRLRRRTSVPGQRRARDIGCRQACWSRGIVCQWGVRCDSSTIICTFLHPSLFPWLPGPSTILSPKISSASFPHVSLPPHRTIFLSFLFFSTSVISFFRLSFLNFPICINPFPIHFQSLLSSLSTLTHPFPIPLL